MTKQMLASMAQSGARFRRHRVEDGQAVVEALPYSDLANWTVDVYATRFTTEDRPAHLVYKTPVGRRPRACFLNFRRGRPEDGSDPDAASASRDEEGRTDAIKHICWILRVLAGLSIASMGYPLSGS